MGFITVDSPGFVIEGLPHILLRVLMEQPAGIYRQRPAVGAYVLIERKSCCLGADIPQSHIHRARQIYRKKGQVPVNVPQLMPYFFPVIGRGTQNHRSNIIVQIAFRHPA